MHKANEDTNGLAEDFFGTLCLVLADRKWEEKVEVVGCRQLKDFR